MWDEAERFLIRDKYISPLIQKWGSCDIEKQSKSEYFADLVEAIISQQLSGSAAETIFGRVKNLCKGNFNPDTILRLSEIELRGGGLSFAKIKYIKDLSKRIKNLKLKIKNLDKLSDDEVISELVQVNGIGRWTAEMFLMFSLARPDVFPVDDLGIKKGFEKVVGQKWDKVKSAKFAEKHWKPFRTVVSWYLWRSLENFSFVEAKLSVG